MPHSRMHKNQTQTLNFGRTRLSTSPCVIGGANAANRPRASSPALISAGCGAFGETCFPNAVAEIVMKTGTSAETSTQASQTGQVTCRWRSDDTVSVGFMAMELREPDIVQHGTLGTKTNI